MQLILEFCSAANVRIILIKNLNGGIEQATQALSSSQQGFEVSRCTIQLGPPELPHVKELGINNGQ